MIRFHAIISSGHLLGVKNLWMVETIDREKVASALDRHWAMSSQSEEPLRVLVQVNTTLEGYQPHVNSICSRFMVLPYSYLLKLGMYYSTCTLRFSSH